MEKSRTSRNFGFPPHDKLVDDWLIWSHGLGKVTAFEAKTHFGDLLDRVSKGEEIVITRHDRPVARLVPEGTPRLDDVRRTVESLRELQEQIRRRYKGKLTVRDVRSAIEKGRL